jgi:hypothetical protein
MQNFVVLTGIRRFLISAESPRDAIAQLKALIEARAHARKHPDIGLSLVDALAQGKLAFLVLDEPGQNILEGEFSGTHQDIPDERLVNAFRHMMSPNMLHHSMRELETRRTWTQSISRYLPEEQI